jgi:hypothetical protein
MPGPRKRARHRLVSVDDVGADVRDLALPIAGPRAADVGVDPIDAPGELLGCDGHRAVALDVVDAAICSHLIQLSIGDASSVPFQTMLVGVEYLSAVALGVIARNRYQWFGTRDSCDLGGAHYADRVIS